MENYLVDGWREAVVRVRGSVGNSCIDAMNRLEMRSFAAVATAWPFAASACAGGGNANAPASDGVEAAADVRADGADAVTDVIDGGAGVDDASADIALDAAFDSADEPSCPTDWPDACVLPIPSWMNSVQRTVNNFCYPCHFPNGLEYPRVDLSSYKAVHGISGGVLGLVKACAMPPPDAAQPTPAEREALVAWLVCAAPNN